MASMVDERGAQAQLHDDGMTGTIECRYYGRDFTAGEMALLRALIAGAPPPQTRLEANSQSVGAASPSGTALMLTPTVAIVRTLIRRLM